MPLVLSGGRTGGLTRVWHTEEKGSDVNLAVELVNDAWSTLFELAVIVSNDSDLARALTIAKKKGRRIGVLVRGDAVVNSLGRFASFSRRLTEANLKGALLPRKIPGTTIEIPAEWELRETRAGIR
ncbi:MAG: NYN domain-containing protein [Gammaproteobacteria bacterium]|nr:NYN domain-containing protein [Gammaproteobacteria bacterium]